MIKYALNAQQMRKIEEPAINSKKKAINLMRKAGAEVYNEIVKRFKPCKVLIICGPGNNGGDGYVVANLLLNDGWDVKLIKIGESKTDSAKYFSEKYKGEVIDKKDLKIEETDLVIDAIYGIGLSQEIDQNLKKVIKKINISKVQCIAIDIPTGVSATTGAILGEAIEAVLTITFHSKKIGHLLSPGLINCGEVIIKDIGLPKIKPEKEYIKINNPNIWKDKIKYLEHFDNKYNRGCLAVIAGKIDRATTLAAQAAKKSGCEIVKLFIKKSTYNHVISEPGIVMIEYNDINDLVRLIDQHKSTAILYTPLGFESDQTEKEVIHLLGLGKEIVFNANSILEYSILSKIVDIKQDILLILTGEEYKRSFGIRENKLNKVKEAIDKSKCTILLNGIDTIIRTKDSIVIQENGCPYLKAAGIQSVLAGMCGTFMSQGVNSNISAMMSTWILSEATGAMEEDLLIEEINRMIPQTILKLINRADANYF